MTVLREISSRGPDTISPAGRSLRSETRAGKRIPAARYARIMRCASRRTWWQSTGSPVGGRAGAMARIRFAASSNAGSTEP